MRHSTNTERTHASCLTLLDALERALNIGVQAAMKELRRQLDVIETEPEHEDVVESQRLVAAESTGAGARTSQVRPVQQRSWWLEISKGDGGAPTLKEISETEALRLTEATDTDVVLNEAKIEAYIRGREKPLTGRALLIIIALAYANAGRCVPHELVAQSIPRLSGRKREPLSNCISQYLRRLRNEKRGLGKELYNRIVEKVKGRKIGIHWKGLSYRWVRRSESNKGPYFPEDTDIPSEDQKGCPTLSSRSSSAT